MGATLPTQLEAEYGGGSTGLMGALANGTLENGGKVFGVIVESMNTPAPAHASFRQPNWRSFQPCTSARPAYELGDGYIALPGGYGTFDELFETLSGTQIGVHSKAGSECKT